MTVVTYSVGKGNGMQCAVQCGEGEQQQCGVQCGEGEQQQCGVQCGVGKQQQCVVWCAGVGGCANTPAWYVPNPAQTPNEVSTPTLCRGCSGE